MAETSSIASRMEKLAKLKRMKLGLSGDSAGQKAKAKPPVAETAAVQPEPEFVPTPQAMAKTAPETAVEVIELPATDIPQTPESAAPLVAEFDSTEAVFGETPEMALSNNAPGIETADDTDVTTSDAMAEADTGEALESAEAAFDFASKSPAESAASESSNLTDGLNVQGLGADDDDLGAEIPADLLDDETEAVAADDSASDATAVSEQIEPDTLGAEIAGQTAPETFPTEIDPEKDPVEASGEADLEIKDDAPGALGGIAAIAGAGLGAAAVVAATDTEATAESEVEVEAVELPDFSATEIEPELLAKEFAHEPIKAPAESGTTELEDGRVALTFDDSRSTLLNHVSRQMNCSIEDVVVTALDWYLDALFGEDDQAKSA